MFIPPSPQPPQCGQLGQGSATTHPSSLVAWTSKWSRSEPFPFCCSHWAFCPNDEWNDEYIPLPAMSTQVTGHRPHSITLPAGWGQSPRTAQTHVTLDVKTEQSFIPITLTRGRSRPLKECLKQQMLLGSSRVCLFLCTDL